MTIPLPLKRRSHVAESAPLEARLTRLATLPFALYLLYLGVYNVRPRQWGAEYALGVGAPGMALLAATVGLFALGWLGSASEITRILRGSLRRTLLVVFFLFTATASVWQLAGATGTAYALLTLSVFVGCGLMWRHAQAHLHRIAVIGAVVYITAMLGAIGLYGVGWGRFVGNLPPNHVADIAVSAVILAWTFSQRLWFRVVILALALGVILTVQSRGALICLGVYFLAANLLNRASWLRSLSRGKMILLSVAGAAACATPLIMPAQADAAIQYVLQDVLLADDAERGAGTGGTGRSERWQPALDNINESPIIGHGFRASTRAEWETSHNAYIDLLRDTGAIGLLLFGTYLVLELIARVRAQRDQMEAYCLAGIVAIAVNAMIEIHLINIGFPLALIMILLLSRYLLIMLPSRT